MKKFHIAISVNDIEKREQKVPGRNRPKSATHILPKGASGTWLHD